MGLFALVMCPNFRVKLHAASVDCDIAEIVLAMLEDGLSLSLFSPSIPLTPLTRPP